MEHSSRGRSNIRQNALAQQLRLWLRHCDVNCFLARLRLHVLATQRVPLALVGWGRGRGRGRGLLLLLLLDQLARGVVLLIGRRQLQQSQSLRWRIRQLPGVALPSITATEPKHQRRNKKMPKKMEAKMIGGSELAKGRVPGERRPGRER